MAKTVKKSLWYIFAFKDFDDIKEYTQDGWKSVELGFLPKKEGKPLNQYFWVVYKGKKPNFDEVWTGLSPLVTEVDSWGGTLIYMEDIERVSKEFFTGKSSNRKNKR